VAQEIWEDRSAFVQVTKNARLKKIAGQQALDSDSLKDTLGKNRTEASSSNACG
jgi:hypothetical protein